MPTSCLTVSASLTAVLGLLRPRQLCRYCSQPCDGAPLCPACTLALQDTLARCRRCALPLADAAGICGECLASPPAFERTLCADSYRPPISHWLQNFKDHRDLRDGQLLGQRLARCVTGQYPHTEPRPDFLLPVPLHWRKALWRSFNQSAWLARQLQRQLNIPVLPALQRTRAGSDQRGLDRRQRQRSLHRVYRVRAGYREQLQHRHVAVIDDVMTTTATARAISRELRRQGVARVDFWCLARTGKRDDRR